MGDVLRWEEAISTDLDHRWHRDYIVGLDGHDAPHCCIRRQERNGVFRRWQPYAHAGSDLQHRHPDEYDPVQYTHERETEGAYGE